MSSQRRAELLLLSVTIVWGSTFVITKVILEESTPLFYTGVRFSLAAAMVLALFFRRMLTIPATTVKKGGVLGLLLFIGFILQTIGLQYTTASKSAFFTGLLVVLTPIVHICVQHLFRLERKPLKLGNVLGVLCAAAGLYFLTSPTGAEFNIGDALSIGCALCFAMYIVYLDSASSEPDKLQLTFVQFVLCGALGFATGLIFEDAHVSTSGGFIAELLYLTIFATVITMWIQNRFQGETTPTRAAVIFAFEPVVAAIFAYAVRGEVLGALGILGGAIILAGLLLSEFSDSMPLLRINLTEA